MRPFRFFAKGRTVRREAGVMNGLERQYAEALELEKRVGNIAWFAFEGIKLRLADRTFYTPDFAVIRGDGTLEIHEVKGHWEDDARVKIKVAAEMFPFKFISAKPKPKKLGGGWEIEEF
jgi:hypothetical protein